MERSFICDHFQQRRRIQRIQYAVAVHIGIGKTCRRDLRGGILCEQACKQNRIGNGEATITVDITFLITEPELIQYLKERRLYVNDEVIEKEEI